MFCYQADQVFPNSSPPIQNGIVVLEEDGTIAGVLDPGASDFRNQDLKPEKLKGILVPGFVNTHCHLELSCFRGQVREGTGMAGFIREFVGKRESFSDSEREIAMEQAEQEMLDQGIVAVGDISNGRSSFRIKSRQQLYYHTFIEVFDLHPSRAETAFAGACRLKDEYVNLLKNRNQVSIVPHAPYTVSRALHGQIAKAAIREKWILSIHNQESDAESELLRYGSGSLQEMYAGMGLDLTWLKSSADYSLKTTIAYYEGVEKILMVHNTCTSETDLNELPSGLSFATCPGANLFIENKLPDYGTFTRKGLNMTIGTDSLASNHGLSILEEMKIISARFEEIPLETLILWSSLNGAAFLGIENRFGSLETGKRPGLLLIEGLDGNRLSAESIVKRLI